MVAPDLQTGEKTPTKFGSYEEFAPHERLALFLRHFRRFPRRWVKTRQLETSGNLLRVTRETSGMPSSLRTEYMKCNLL